MTLPRVFPDRPSDLPLTAQRGMNPRVCGYAVARPERGSQSNVSIANELDAVANGLAAVSIQLDGLMLYLSVPPNPAVPPSPIGPVNQLSAIDT